MSPTRLILVPVAWMSFGHNNLVTCSCIDIVLTSDFDLTLNSSEWMIMISCMFSFHLQSQHWCPKLLSLQSMRWPLSDKLYIPFACILHLFYSPHTNKLNNYPIFVKIYIHCHLILCILYITQINKNAYTQIQKIIQLCAPPPPPVPLGRGGTSTVYVLIE